MHYAGMKTKAIAPHTESTVLEFLEAATRLQRRLDHALSNIRGISFSEYRLLRALAGAQDDGFPRIDLANAVGLTASAVTRALKPLEKLGYVRTERSERDARQSRAVITSAGCELLKDSDSILHDTLSYLPLNALSARKVEEFQARLNEMTTSK